MRIPNRVLAGAQSEGSPQKEVAGQMKESKKKMVTVQRVGTFVVMTYYDHSLSVPAAWGGQSKIAKSNASSHRRRASIRWLMPPASMKGASDCKQQQASKQHDKNPEVSERPYLLSKNPPFIVVYLSIVVHLSCSINALNNAQQNGSRSLTASPDGLGHRHRRAFCPHRHGGW